MTSRLTDEELRVALWDAIDQYVRACHGDPSKHVYGNTSRQRCVAEIEGVVFTELRAARESLELLRARLADVEQLAQGFSETVRAAEHNLTREKGGQHVPYHGDFAAASPSVIAKLKWWSREFLDRLTGAKP